MRRTFTMIGILLSTLCVGLLPAVALASESDSFDVSGDPGNNASADTGTSTSYQIDDASLTWRETSGSSDSFGQGAPDTTTGGDSGGTTGGTTGGDSGTAGGTSSGGGTGGHRGEGTIGGGTTGGSTDGESEDESEQEPSPSEEAPSEETPSESVPSEPTHEAAPQVPASQGEPSIFDSIEFSGREISGNDGTFRVLTNVYETPFQEVDAPVHAAAEDSLVVTFVVAVLTLAMQNRVVLAILVGVASLLGLLAATTMQFELWFLFFPLFVSPWEHWNKRRRLKKSPKAKRRAKGSAFFSLVLLVALAASFIPTKLHAVATVPQYIIYNGQLKNASGTAITTMHAMRFSFWSNADAVPADLNGDHTINTNASNYAGWTEILMVKPNSSGYFSARLGSGTSLKAFTEMLTSELQNLHLQVEVKSQSAPITAFEILDPNPSAAIDRSPMVAVPFALNADLLDQRDVGTGSGNITILGPGGKFAPSVTGSGTNLSKFTLDYDNTESADISLEFGRTLGKKLSYDVLQGLFRFNDDVEIQGNLTVTGLVNGINLTQLQSSTGTLKASSGGGLNLGVSYGSYRLNGVVTNYVGGNITLAPSTTNYIFFGSGGLQKNLTGFPTDESIIQVAQATTSAGSILTVVDRRVMTSDDREESVVTTFSPNYEKAAFQADGADNVGQLSVDSDNVTLRNFYKWTSTKTTLQDYDILLKVPLSPDFIRWSSTATVNPLSITYRSTNASSGNNKLDVQVYDTNGTPVTLSGSATSLANTSWTTTQLEFTGSPTWTPAGEILVRLKVSAKDTFQIHLGALQLKYVDLKQE